MNKSTSIDINNVGNENINNENIDDISKQSLKNKNISDKDNNIIIKKQNSIKVIEEKIKSKINEENNIDNKLIDAKIILNKIKTQEEEFIFFVTYATSKILQYEKNESEIYISLIFLNEILKKIPDKQFGKIWPNIFNIFKTKMVFKEVNEDNIFQILFINFFLTQIIKDYFNNVLNEDYGQILETYEEIGSVELLLIILDINDLFIKSAIKLKKKYIFTKY